MQPSQPELTESTLPIPPITKWSWARLAALALAAFLCACAFYGRWSPSEWSTPIEYGIDGPASDVKSVFASVKIASQGHYIPLFFKKPPELGAPFGASWDDYPAVEQIHIAVAGFLAYLFGLFGAVNLVVVLGHVYAALGFYVAARLLDYRRPWVVVGAFLFAFCQYLFARCAHHFTVLYVGHVPLAIVAVRWALAEKGLERPRWAWALGIAALCGVNHIYYTNLFVQFLGLAFLWHALHRRWRPAWRAVAVGSVAVAGFVVMMIPTKLAALANGPNPIAVSRNFMYLEFSGFKLADLFITPPNYWMPALASWGRRYFEEVILKGETPEGSYLGLLGCAALVWMGVAAFRRILANQPQRPPWEALLALWAVFYATVGGFNCWLGSLGFVIFRSSTRYTIFILALALLFAARRLSALSARWGAQPMLAAALFVALIGVPEQIPPRHNESQEGIAHAVASDRAFAEEMEAALPPRAMVFQLPIMRYPEAPAMGVPSSDHFRPYIYTNTLRYSFGDMKGHRNGAWQEYLLPLSPEEQMKTLERYGFGALYINKNGFQDRGAAYEKAATQRGAKTFTSKQGDLLGVLLNPSPAPELPPKAPYFGQGWSELDNSVGPEQRRRFCRGTGEILVNNPGSASETKYLHFILVGLDGRVVTLSGGGTSGRWQLQPNAGARADLRVTLTPGDNRFTFTTDQPTVPSRDGPVAFLLINFDVTDQPQ